tara:strand:+ start:259 stop:579 length:321 start_codon:yes stop_codon:yes gene_type:complete
VKHNWFPRSVEIFGAAPNFAASAFAKIESSNQLCLPIINEIEAVELERSQIQHAESRMLTLKSASIDHLSSGKINYRPEMHMTINEKTRCDMLQQQAIELRRSLAT